MAYDDDYREVSSHLPARGGSRAQGRDEDVRKVSSHLPARGGSFVNRPHGLYHQFPVTSPRGEDLPHNAVIGWAMILFPVTSPRGEDQGFRVEIFGACGVSSHLPARGGSSRPG